MLIPFLPKIIGVSAYGVFNITQMTAQLFIPLIGLNAATAILREGAVDLKLGSKLFYSLNNLSVLLALFLFPFVFIFDFSEDNWFLFGIVLSLVEILFLNQLTLYRAAEKANSYLKLSLIKVGGFLSIVLLLGEFYENLGFRVILLVQILWYLVLILTYINWKEYEFKFYKEEVWAAFSYTLVLIPHSFFQWIINNIDKYIIKHFYGSYDMGTYSIIYNVALIFVLLNSGISLTLPQYIFKNYEFWLKSNTRAKFIFLYSLIAGFLSLIIYSLVYLEVNYLNFTGIEIDFSFALSLLSYLLGGFYLFGIYFFYGNFILYHRKSVILMVQTLFAAIVNVLLNFILIPKFGLLGASYSTFITYGLYTGSVVIWSSKVEKGLGLRPLKELLVVPLILTLIVLLPTLVFR